MISRVPTQTPSSIGDHYLLEPLRGVLILPERGESNVITGRKGAQTGGKAHHN